MNVVAEGNDRAAHETYEITALSLSFDDIAHHFYGERPEGEQRSSISSISYEIIHPLLFAQMLLNPPLD